MKILIVASRKASWPYVPELVQALSEAGQEPSILDTDTMELITSTEQRIILAPKFKATISWLWGPVRSIYKLLALSQVLRKFSNEPWDVVNIHFILPVYVLIRRRFSNAGTRLILTYWGSDFLRADRTSLFIQKWLHSVADVITFNNPIVSKEFIKQYPKNKSEIRVVRFGFRSIDFLDSILFGGKEKAKKRFSIPDGAICLALGYNASIAQDHISMIEAIRRLDLPDKASIFIMIPATYPDNTEYVCSLREQLDKTGYPSIIIEEHLSMNDLCLLRMAADIIVNIQKTDSFSASIQEYAYSGAAMVLGSWLPYGLLEDAGVLLYKVDDINDITKAVYDLLHGSLATYQNGQEARQGIRSLSGWKENITSWLKLYTGEQ